MQHKLLQRILLIKFETNVFTSKGVVRDYALHEIVEPSMGYQM